MATTQRRVRAVVTPWILSAAVLTAAACGSKASTPGGQPCVGDACTAVTISSITVSPATASQPAGVPQDFTAIATFTDGTTTDVTSTATWSSSDDSVAPFLVSGTARGLRVGSVQVTAALQGVSTTAQLRITAATASLLAVTCAPAVIAKGTVSRCGAVVTFSNGSRQDVSGSATWTSSSQAVATVVAGSVRGLTAGATLVRAAFGGKSGSAAVTVTDAVLTGIALSPAGPISIPNGFVLPLTANGTFSDGSTQDVTALAGWSSSDGLVASVVAGVVTGVGQGAATVTATLGVLVASVQVSVTAAAPVSLSISCGSQALGAGTGTSCTAFMLFTDGAKQDVTASASWSTSDPGVATVVGGSVTGVAAGTASISASAAGLSASSTVTVTGAVLVAISVSNDRDLQEVPAGVDLAYTATGIFSDQTQQDLTSQVTWATGDAAVATISPAGVATGVGPGTTTILASIGALAGSTSLTVTVVTLQGIDVFASEAAIAKGTSVAVQAQGTYSDGSTQDLTSQVSWTSDPAVSLSAAGGLEIATGATEGTAVVTASLAGLSGSVTLTVTSAALVSIAVAPSPATIPAGFQQPFTATGTFSDGSTQELTQQAAWSSSDPSLATASNVAGAEGMVSAIQPGVVTITATALGVSGGAVVTVSPAVLQTLAVTPTSATVQAGFQVQFHATGGFSDGTSRDVTDQAVWSSSNTAVAVISTSGATRGLASGVSIGTTTIAAALEGITAAASLKVVNATLQSVSVSPNPFTVGVKAKTSLVATGTFSDGSTSDVTRLCNWSSSAKSIAWVSKAGVVTGMRAGSVTITAKRIAKRGQAAGTVQ